MDGIQYHPDDSRRNYSNNGKYEMLSPRQSALQSSYNSNTQCRFSHGGTAFTAFKTPAVTYDPLSPPASDYGYSPAPFAPPLNAPSSPLSPPATEWSGSPPPSASTPVPSTPPNAISTTERCNRSYTPPGFQITVHDLTGRVVTLNDITPSMKVSRLKEKFEEKEGIPTNEQKLIFGGKELTEGTVYFYLLPPFK